MNFTHTMNTPFGAPCTRYLKKEVRKNGKEKILTITLMFGDLM